MDYKVLRIEIVSVPSSALPTLKEIHFKNDFQNRQYL